LVIGVFVNCLILNPPAPTLKQSKCGVKFSILPTINAL
jgi:hypothetical protein